MQYKTDALLLRAVDYGENDKIVTLLTADLGKIGAGVKGVKKAGAKLRFAAQPFCFAEYVLAERGGRYTATGASLYDGFYSVTESVETYYAAAAVCEACDKLVFEGMDAKAPLLFAVNALKELSAGKGAAALIGFLLKLLASAGYPVGVENCPKCGKELNGRMRFDFASGAFFCDGCGIGEPASENTYLTLRRIAGLSGETSADGEKRALRLLYTYFFYQTDLELNALKEYVKLV